MSRSTKIYAAIAATLAVILTIIGVWAYRASSHSAVVSAQLEVLSSVEESLSADPDAQEAIAALVKLRAEYERLKEQGVTNEAKARYEELLASLTDMVENAYKSAFDELEIPDVATAPNDKQIRDARDQLKELLAQIEADAAVLDVLGVTKKYTGKITERISEYEARLSVLAEEKRRAEEEAKKKAEEEEAKRKADEEAKRQAAEEDKRKAEQEALRAASHYENDHFTLDFPEDWAGKWSVGIRHATDYGVTYFVNVSGVANNPSGGGGDSVVVACGGEPLSNPMNKYVGTLSSGRCDVYVRHEFGFPFIGESSGMGAAQLTLK